MADRPSAGDVVICGGAEHTLTRWRWPWEDVPIGRYCRDAFRRHCGGRACRALPRYVGLADSPGDEMARAWERAIADIRAAGDDPGAVVAQAAATLEAWGNATDEERKRVPWPR